MKAIKTALVSVSDKTNLETLAKFFIENEVDVVSTGGTFKALKDLGVAVRKVSEQTGFPEVMDGRVKTLHPKIHMALLARAEHSEDLAILEDHQIKKFDMLVVNLYPFSKKKSEGLKDEELVEFIDVGGPSMIRAGAKNFNRMLVLTSPEDYRFVNTEEIYSFSFRQHLAGKAFQHLSEYDKSIYSWLLNEEKVLRYGENPHQKAVWAYSSSEKGLHQANILQGKELSFNNLVDLTAAVESMSVFIEGSSSVAVSVKHNNPCGLAVGDSLSETLSMSLKADPKSVFGGIVAVNQQVDLKSANLLAEIFLECVVAPSFSEEAKERLSKKKNLRLLEWPEMVAGYAPKKDFKRVSGGLVEQDFDSLEGEAVTSWEQVSGEEPSEDVLKAMSLSWKAVARLKSNAIAVTGSHYSLGQGMGQVNRVDAVKSALQRWQDFHPEYKGPVVLASDAFFPFPDSIEAIAEAGVKWVVQPGGSIKDEEVIKRAKELGVNMFFTGKRHFLH